MFRAVKNKKGTLIVISEDYGQSGNYPEGSSSKNRIGVWCKWTFEQLPPLEPIEGADIHALRYKENKKKNGVALRSAEEVLSSHT